MRGSCVAMAMQCVVMVLLHWSVCGLVPVLHCKERRLTLGPAVHVPIQGAAGREGDMVVINVLHDWAVTVVPFGGGETAQRAT